MPGSPFRGDPYRVLDLSHDASDDQIKRRWRDLAREHHPDRALHEGEERDRQTTRMARINAAYDVLRDPVRRARYDASPEAQRARHAGGWTRSRSTPGVYADEQARPAGPPSPPPTRPVTARFDTSAAFLRHNAVSAEPRTVLRGHAPVEWRGRQGGRDLRASDPTGPVRRQVGARPRLPSLAEARDTVLDFGRFHGWTLGEVADREPTYVDWIANTITRDRDLVVRARVIAADLDAHGVARQPRTPDPEHADSHRAAGETRTADRAAG